MALKLGPALLVILSSTAIMVGVIFHAISIDELNYSSPPATNFEPNVEIGNQDKNLIWFLQVTDLHLSNRGDFDRATDLKEFAKNYVDIIRPGVVLVTGDITDGRKPNTTFDTGPQLDEWLAYNKAVTESGALGKTKWLDVRGNHDNFNVYRPNDPNTLYRRYSITGKEHARNYMVTHTDKQGKNYTFIGVDEVQTPGLKIPFNFIGIVEDEDIDELKHFKEVARDKESQYTIWFAHYPTASIASPNEGLRNIVDGPYLCGHYHTIGNLVTQMYATQQPGFVEVELGDWKHNRRIRLASIDHQLFNFVDVGFREFPIALMTNPKRAEFMMPKYEPIDRLSLSTHIRVIAFSNSTIKTVEVSIDGGQRELMSAVAADSPLYVKPWLPRRYSTGLHSAEIYVEDSAGLRRTFNQSFSLDNEKGDFALGAKMLLRAHIKTSVMTLFFCVIAICCLPMIVLRLVIYHHQDSGIKRHYRGTFLYSLHLLCKINRLFIPLIVVPVWISVGPLFVGYMVDQAIGACFVWGVLIDEKFVYTGLTYNVFSVFLTLVHVPEIILLTNQVSDSANSLKKTNKAARVLNLKFFLHLLLSALQCWMGSLLFSAYGLMSYLTCFPFLWCTIIYNCCWYQCSKLEKSDFETFDRGLVHHDEHQSLTGQRGRDDKSSASDHSSL